jgi:hypothetical protein
MPLTAKGEEIKSAMEKQYGAEKGEEVFYASKNAGTITGVDAADAARPFGAADPVDCGDAARDQESMLHPPALLPEPDLEHPQQYPGASAPPELATDFAGLDVNGGITGGVIPQTWGTPEAPFAAGDALPTEVGLADIEMQNAGQWAQWGARPLGPDQK